MLVLLALGEYHRAVMLDLLWRAGGVAALLVAILNTGLSTATSFDHLSEYEQEWGYVDVRAHAHMFYWLFYTWHEDGYQARPLIIWLQGGPGYSSVGHGNMDEIGPLDTQGNIRNTSWVNEASLLFVDSPVGVGFSYVDTDDARPQRDETVAQDLVTMFAHFIQTYPNFQEVPLYVFGQSYGGKMAALFTWTLHQAILAGSLRANLQGVAMGNAWVSPIPSVLSWGPFLHSMSVLDKLGMEDVRGVAKRCRTLAENNQWSEAADCMFDTQARLHEFVPKINIYNALKFEPNDARKKRATRSNDQDFFSRFQLPSGRPDELLEDAMNGPVRAHLGVIPESTVFEEVQIKVFENLKMDFMKSTAHAVESLLSQTDLQVVVYQGQVDVICATLGTYEWVDRLEWADIQRWRDSLPVPLWSADQSTINSFIKSTERFSFYNVLQAGHEVPVDQPHAALQMVRSIFDHANYTSPVNTGTATNLCASPWFRQNPRCSSGGEMDKLTSLCLTLAFFAVWVLRNLI